MLDRFQRTPLLSDWVPVEDYLGDRALLLSDGSVYACFEAEGRPAETADALARMRWHDALNAALRNLCSDRLALKVKLCRGYADPAAWPRLECDIPFVEDLVHGYRDRLLDRALYENRLFVTLEYRPARPAGEWIGGKLEAAHRQAAAAAPRASETTQERLDHLERACDLLATALADHGLRRLGLVDRENGVFDEMLEAEAFVATGVWRPIGMTTGRPGNVLLSEDVTFHHEHIEIRGPGHTVYAAHLGFKEYPAGTWPGMLDALLAVPFRFSLVQSFRFMEQSEGQGVLTRKQNKMVWANDKAHSQIAALTRAADELQSGGFVMGDHALTLCVFADRAGAGSAFHDRLVARLREGARNAGLPARAADVFEAAVQSVIGRPDSNPLSDVVNAAWKALGSCGCVVARENKALMGAWLSMLPGNDRHRPRPGAISSRNFAGFNPLHGYAKGPAASRWGGPVAVTLSPGGTPYRFHWHDGDGDGAVGNTLITGETGSGKTATTAFMIANTLARVWSAGGGWVGLDHKRGWNAMALALGGGYAALGDGEPHFAPMKALPDTPRSREFLTELLRGCVRQGGWRDLAPEEDHRLALGIATVMGNPPGDRWIREVQAFLGDEPDGAGARLRKWCWGGELGWVLDAPADRVDMRGDINAFDTTRLLANARARGPAMLYLFFRIEMRLGGAPLLITVDEGWYVLLEEEAFRPAMDKISRTIRSKNGVLVFITQSPGDPVRAGMGPALVEQFPNQMHFANARVRREDFTRGLMRTDGEYDALMALRKGSGAFLLCKGGQSSIQSAPLQGLDDALAVLSTSEANLEAIDGMDEADRADPIRFQAEYHRRRKAIAERNRRARRRAPHGAAAPEEAVP